MNTLIRRNPYGEFDNMIQSMERTFETLWGDAMMAATHPVPMDIFEKDDALFVRASLPGIRPEDVEVTAEKNVLTIRGETRAEWETSEPKVYRRENRYGQFTRSVRLPEGYLPEKAVATFDNVVVLIHIPRDQAPQGKVHRIEVTTSQKALPVEGKKSDKAEKSVV